MECNFLFDKVGENGELPRVDAYKHWLSTNRIFQEKELEILPSLEFLDLVHSFAKQLESENSVLTMNIHRLSYRIPYIFPDARYIHL